MTLAESVLLVIKPDLQVITVKKAVKLVPSWLDDRGSYSSITQVVNSRL